MGGGGIIFFTFDVLCCPCSLINIQVNWVDMPSLDKKIRFFFYGSHHVFQIQYTFLFSLSISVSNYSNTTGYA